MNFLRVAPRGHPKVGEPGNAACVQPVDVGVMPVEEATEHSDLHMGHRWITKFC